MLSNWLKILLFVAGGVTAAVGTAYFTGLWDPQPAGVETRPMAAADTKSDGSSSAAVDVEGTTPSDEERESDENIASAAPGANDGEAANDTDSADAETETGLTVPSFDIVRVEPDGSMVIAGKAAPRADIEVVSGATVIARAEAGPDGDFAAVLDDRLSPGDYQIVLRSTEEGNVVATSLETAIVSVPDTDDGDVLALVEEPGEPSKLITVPEASAGSSEGSEADASVGAEENASTDASAEAQPDDNQTARVAAAQESSGDPAVTADGEAQPSMDESTETDAADETAEQDVVPPADRPEDAAGAEGSNGGQQADDVDPNEVSTEQEVASRDEPAGAAQPRLVPALPTQIAVEAVEIEGRTVFVAGRGEAGSTVRVYANEILLGEADVSEGGRFLVEAEIELPVGEYIVRADVIGGAGQVIARAAVPFEREPGESIAAIAAPMPGGSRAEPEQNGASDGEEQVSAPIANAPSVPRTSNGSEGEQSEGNVPTATPEQRELADARPVGETSASSSEPLPSAPLGESDPVRSAPIAENGDGSPAAAQPVATAIDQVTTAPKLQSVDGSVIIRRGDTLWHISRRVYGRGVRYSTIYLANQDQIRDPDMIWPGQVFSVPDHTEEGDTADYSTIEEQLAPTDAGTQ